MPALSGQTTVPTAGTAVALGTQIIAGALLVKALASNTGLVYVGNDGSHNVTSANGYPLAAGDQVIFEHVAQLSNIRVNAAVNNEGVAWLTLNI